MNIRLQLALLFLAAMVFGMVGNWMCPHGFWLPLSAGLYIAVGLELVYKRTA